MNGRQPEVEVTVEDLRKVLLESLELDSRDEHLAEAERIQDVVAMDSVALLQFVVALEVKYGISLEEDWLTIDRLTDLPALARYIRQGIGVAAAPGKAIWRFSEEMICDLLDQVASARPEQLAIIDGDVSLTYRELVRRSLVLSNHLKERLRVGEGSIVAISLPNSWQYPVAFLAVARLGAVLMPFNPQWRAAEISWFLQRFGIGTVITNGELRSGWSEVAGSLPDDRILIVDGVEMQRLWDQPSDGFGSRSGRAFDVQPVLYLATSGTTGRPKVVPRSHLNLLAGRSAVAGVLGIRPGHRFLGVIPFHHANGFANCMFLPLASGGTVVVSRNALPSALAARVKRERIQIVIGSPFLYSLLADQLARPEDLSSVEMYISSGAPLPDGVAALWREHYGKAIRQLYGSSETGTICIEEADAPAVPGSVGRPLPTVALRILSHDGATLPSGRSGEILVRSPAMMAGYVDEPELNRQAYDGGFFRMGDLGSLTTGGLLVIEGRSKRWINSGGIKVDPVEVEGVLLELPSVRQCRVHAGRDARGLEALTLTIALNSGLACSRRDIVEHCRKRLAEYKIPRVIHFVESIPTDLTGKTTMEWSPR